MRRRIYAYICISIVTACILLPGCNGEGEAGSEETQQEGEGQPEEKKGDAYDDYIRSALASVDNGKDPFGDAQATPVPGTGNNGQSVQTDRTAPDESYISSMESPDDYDPFDTYGTPTPTDTETPTPTEDPDATPTPTPTPYITPQEFDVGTCCIYINGESDSAYGTEIVTAINNTRKDLGYTEFESNTGLATCADRRTREIAANFAHVRPNGQMFYSLAPDHFKAEMLIINNQKAEEAVDTLIKNDPVSRNLIFTNKYRSIGASSFKCNGMSYTVVAFGL